MGCDIHLQVQRRVSGEWVFIDELPARPCSWCDGDKKNSRGETCWECSGTGVISEAYHDRNYEAFAILADVRNRYDITPIAPPRGLPDGLATVDEYSSEFGDHSFSWLTLAELQAHDWTQKIEHSGFVNLLTYKEWKAAGADDWPDMWCQGTSADKVSNEEADRLIATGDTSSVYTFITWHKTHADSCRSFMKFMESLTSLGAPEDVRIVFGFDS